jgi:hypothetical protein
MFKVNRVSDEYFDANRSTSHNNVNEYFEWVNDGSGEITIFIDNKISDIFSDLSKTKKYGWLLESRTIIPEVFEFVENNIDSLLGFCEGIFTCDTELAKRPGFHYVISNAAPWVLDKRIHDKTKLLSIIASNKSWAEGHKNRLALVEKYKPYADLYGRGINEIASKEDGLCDYMFSIAIENCSYGKYYTEKLTDCFATGTIPVWYGDESVLEDFNRDGVILLDDNFDINSLTPELYYSKINAIKENFYAACEMFTSEDYIYRNYFEGL